MDKFIPIIGISKRPFGRRKKLEILYTPFTLTFVLKSGSTVQCRVYSVECTVYSVQCTVHVLKARGVCSNWSQASYLAQRRVSRVEES